MGKISGIYIIRNIINGKSYIGSSFDIHKRWLTHKRLLRNGKHHSILLQRSWNKHGGHNFIFDIVEEINPITEILEYNEQTAIWLFRPAYNISQIPGRLPEMTDERRKQLSLSNSGENAFYFGKKRPDHAEKLRGANNYNYGKKYDENRLIRMSKQRLGLNEMQVYEAINMLKNGETQASIARHFNVSHAAIVRLLSNKIKAYPSIYSKDIDKKKIGVLGTSGSNNWFSKLKEEDVHEIRNRRNIMGESIASISIKYNISECTVSAITGYKSWRHLENKDNVIPDYSNSKRVLDTQTGIFYDSVKEAAWAKCLNSTSLSGWLRGRTPNRTGLVYV